MRSRLVFALFSILFCVCANAWTICGLNFIRTGTNFWACYISDIPVVVDRTMHLDWLADESTNLIVAGVDIPASDLPADIQVVEGGGVSWRPRGTLFEHGTLIFRGTSFVVLGLFSLWFVHRIFRVVVGVP